MLSILICTENSITFFLTKEKSELIVYSLIWKIIVYVFYTDKVDEK